MDYAKEIQNLKKERNALILAHNYQVPEVQDVADFTGDSLDLCRKASKTEAEYIVFCGVDFMAETASILTGKKVLFPEPDARCPMAAQLSLEHIWEAKRKHPHAPLVLYINTLAEAKAEADAICTSANMVEVIDAMKGETVLFGPDSNMACYASKRTKKRIITVPEGGYCIVHKNLLQSKTISAMMKEHPNAIVLAHPECNPDVQALAHHIASTNGMLKLAKELPGKEFIVATEEGLGYRLTKENPNKTFYVINGAVCRNMKKTTLEKVYRCLLEKSPLIEVPNKTAGKARKAIDRMMELSKG